MKTQLLLAAIVLVCISTVGCGKKFKGPPVLASSPTCADPTDKTNVFRSETGNNLDCETVWDLESEPHSPAANHSDIYLTDREKTYSGFPGPRKDVLNLVHSKGKQFIYCVRPNPTGTSNPGGGPTDPKNPCPAPPPAQNGCNQYPFVNGTTGDPDALKWRPVHRLELAPLLTPDDPQHPGEPNPNVCSYKLSFWIRKNKNDQNPILIDPHIVIGTGGTRL